MFIAGKTGHFRALGSRLCGSGGWVRKFLVPAHFRSFPSVASIQPDDRLLAGGLERALGSRLCGSGGWVRKFHVPDHFRSFPSVATGHAGAGCSLGDRYWDGFLPVREWRLGTEISCSRSFPLISAHFRALPPVRRGQAARWGLGTEAGFCLCRSGGWVRKFLVSRSFPLISERCLHSGGGRLFVGPEMRLKPAPTCRRHGSVAVGPGPSLHFAGVTGHFRALVSCLCGSGGWVRKFHVPDHFRSFPSVASGQAGAGCPLGPGTEVGLKPAPTHLASRGNDRNYCSHTYDENTTTGGASSRGGSDGGGVPNHGVECDNTALTCGGGGFETAHSRCPPPELERYRVGGQRSGLGGGVAFPASGRMALDSQRRRNDGRRWELRIADRQAT